MSAKNHDKAADRFTALNLLQLPWRMTLERDRKAIAKLLSSIGIARQGNIEAITAFVCQRSSEARDLFVQRGVRTKRETVLALAAKSLSQDAVGLMTLESIAGPDGASVIIQALLGRAPIGSAIAVRELTARVAPLPPTVRMDVGPVLLAA